MVRCARLALVALVFPTTAYGAVTVEQNLDLTIVPTGTTRTVLPTDSTAARYRLTLDGVRCDSGPATITFSALPSQLDDGGAATLPLTYGAASARIEEEANSGNNATFDPTVGTTWAYDAFPAIVTLGASTTAGASQTVASYAASPVTLELDYERLIVVCVPHNDDDDATMAAEVQPGLDVAATNGPLDLGMLFQGETVVVPADDSGSVSSAQFAASGPSGLNWQLTVTTSDLQHASLADTLTLTFTSGLYGTVSPPASSFSDGAIVSSGTHGGALDIWLGYQVVVPANAAEGAYSGSITLTVDALLE